MVEKNVNTRKTNEEFIKEAISIHSNRFDYSLVDYKSNKTNIKIICKTHGVFEQTPKSHLKGSGCVKCNSSRGSRYQKEEIIEKLKEKYGDDYKYPDFEFNSLNDEIILICKKHGEIKKKIIQHLNYGCKKCYYDIMGDSTRSNKEEFIIKSNKFHNNRYDYSLVNYISSSIKVTIICKDHGKFKQIPYNHISGSGCPKCNRSKGESLIENFLLKNKINFYTQFMFHDCRLTNPLKFDFYLYDHNICIEFDGVQHYAKDDLESYFYDETIKIRDDIKTEYCKNNNIKLIRIKYHSIKNIDSILSKILKKENVLSMEKKKEVFIKKSIELWGYKYDYSRVDYIDYKTPVKIGYKGLWYSQTPNKHLQGKRIECQETRMSTDNFIILSKGVWGDDRFDYSECEYLGTSVKVRLYDKLKNKWIEQVPKSHLKGYEVSKLTKEEFYERSNLIHDYKYQYNLDSYNSGLNTKLDIICGEHGLFTMKAATHIYGTGCSKCDEYKFNKIIKKYLDKNDISYKHQHFFEHSGLPFDFYLPKYRTVIEFDGIQHHQPVEHFGGLESYERLKTNDKIKNDYCEDNFIELIRIRYDQIDRIYDILNESLRMKIKSM
jgi:very-short-patch-repair endonuclease